MTKEFTHDYMKDNCGCYEHEQLMNCSFMQSEPVTIDAILNSEIPLKDKYWFVCRKLLTREQNQQVALSVAEIVLPIFEKRHPEDKRPREAIEAAKQYIAGHISLEALREKRDAAVDAAAAAVDAAVDAAAYAAVDAAAYAADAADAYAADAAAYAVDAAAYAIKQELLNYLITFCNNN